MFPIRKRYGVYILNGLKRFYTECKPSLREGALKQHVSSPIDVQCDNSDSFYIFPILNQLELVVMPQNILLVDDDTDALYVLKTILNGEGYTTYAATSLEEAIDAVEDHEVDLAIIDFLIPGCQGDMIAKLLKNVDESLQIIFLSGHEGIYEAVDNLSFPVYKIFMKPENINEILSTIRSIFADTN